MATLDISIYNMRLVQFATIYSVSSSCISEIGNFQPVHYVRLSPTDISNEETPVTTISSIPQRQFTLQFAYIFNDSNNSF